MTKNIVNCTCALAEVLRSFAPLSGDEYRALVLVELKPGEGTPPHNHKHHTVVYYPQDARPITIEPKAGMLLYMPPGTPHNVPPGDAARVSVAMVIDAEKC